MSKLTTFIIVLLIIAITAMGYFDWQKYQDKRPVYQIQGTVGDISGSSFKMQAAFGDGHGGHTSKTLNVSTDAGTVITNNTVAPAVGAKLSDMGGSNILLPASIILSTKDNPQNTDQVKALKVEITKMPTYKK